MKIYKCYICDRFKPDVVKRKVYKPSVTKSIEVIPLCSDCGKYLYEQKKWLVMTAI